MFKGNSNNNILDESRIFPNPANEKIKLISPRNNNLYIYDQFGKLMRVISATELALLNNEIDIQFLPVGVYFIELSDTGGSYYEFKKILVIR